MSKNNDDLGPFGWVILVAIVLGLLFLVISIFEPNTVYFTEGVITKIQTDSKILSEKCEPKKGKNGKMIRAADCREKKSKIVKSVSGYEVVYYDQKGKQTVDITKGERLHWGMIRTLNKLPTKLREANVKIYLGSILQPYIGCKVTVYYKIGDWLDDRSWSDPAIDASMCTKQKAEKGE